MWKIVVVMIAGLQLTRTRKIWQCSARPRFGKIIFEREKEVTKVCLTVIVN